METAVIKRIGYKVRRKLKIVQAMIPTPKPTDEQFLAELGSAAAGSLERLPAIFPGLIDSSMARSLSRMMPEDFARAELVARQALQHRFNLLGSGWVDAGRPIDWSRDFKSGKRWATRDYRLQRIVDLTDDSDVKVPWELSRCQHFLPMAILYLAEGDPAFAAAYENQVNSWIDANEFGQTVNWSCPMDIALRCLNWLAAYQLFAARNDFGERFRQRLTLELYKGGRAIRENLEKIGSGFNTNHYLADLVGLLHLGWMFRDVPAAHDWFDLAHRELEQELQSQVTTDGIDYESSLPYHGLVTEMFFYAMILSERCGRPFSTGYAERLRQMIANLARFTRADGTVEPFGDNDDGRVFRLLWRGSRDYRDLLSLACGHDPELQLPGFTPTPEEAFIGTGSSSRRHAAAAASTWSSDCFVKTGICQMRAPGVVLNFFNNEVGTAGLGNHKHNDLLSFTLEYDGFPVFVDPGSFVYTADAEARNQFRSTRAHNTVMIDDQEQNRMVPGLLFHLRPDGRPQVTHWQSTDKFDLAVAEHNCYERLDQLVRHRRAVLLLKHPVVILIRDELLGRGEHEAEFNFHLDRMGVETSAQNRVLLRPSPQSTPLLFAELLHESGFNLLTDWISPAYGVRYPAIRLTQWLRTELPCTMLYAIVPLTSSELSAIDTIIRQARDFVGW